MVKIRQIIDCICHRFFKKDRFGVSAFFFKFKAGHPTNTVRHEAKRKAALDALDAKKSCFLALRPESLERLCVQKILRSL